MCRARIPASVSTTNPFELGANQKDKPKKKARDKSSDMSKIVHMWKNSNS